MFCNFIAQMREAYLKLYPGGSNKTTFSQFASIPNLKSISKTLYMVPDPTENVEQQPIWCVVLLHLLHITRLFK